MSYSVCKFRHKMCDGCMTCYDDTYDDDLDLEDEEDEEEDEEE